jgi:ATP/maltotriose-dependent transcriptional regulator MalT
MTAFAEIGDWGGAGWAMGLLGWVRFWQGRLDEAERLAEQIRDEAQQTNERWALAMMVLLLANIRLWRGRPDEAVDLAREAVSIFSELGDMRFSMQAHVPLIRGLAFSGRVVEATELLDAGAAIIDSLPERNWVAKLITGSVAVHLGDGERAVRDAGVGLTDEQRKGLTEPERLTILGYGHLLCGRTPEALVLLERANDVAVASGPHSNVASALALARAAAGHADAALEAADSVIEGTYLDRTIAALARGFAELQRRDFAASTAAFDDATGIVAGTRDVLHQSLVRLARAHALDVRGDPAAPDELAAARARLAGMGVTAGGWETAYLLSARGGVPG